MPTHTDPSSRTEQSTDAERRREEHRNDRQTGALTPLPTSEPAERSAAA